MSTVPPTDAVSPAAQTPPVTSELDALRAEFAADVKQQLAGELNVMRENHRLQINEVRAQRKAARYVEEDARRAQEGLPPRSAYESPLDVQTAPHPLPSSGIAVLRLKRAHAGHRAGDLLEFHMSAIEQRIAAGELVDSDRAEVI